jgi:thiamine-monophosphate kinase
LLGPSTVADVSERELVARIQQQLPPTPPWVLVGIGDDAAIVEPERNRVEVLTVDAIVEGVHFDRAFVPPDAIGHRALAVNLSDLAAMGAAPRLALLSMALPSTFPLADFDGVVSGLTSLAAAHRLQVIGGNLTRSPGPLVIDVTLVGTVKRRQALTRGGAKPGDDLYVSGAIGAAAAGLGLLRKVVSHQSSVVGQQSSVVGLSPQSIDDLRLRLMTNDSRQTTDDSRLTTDDWRLMTAYLTPEPRIRLGLLLGRNRAASACVDLSDGLADGVRRIAEASGVGVIVDASLLPIDPAARAFFEAQRLDPVEASLEADDYQLLVAVRPRARGRLAAAIRHGGAPLTRIGRCTEDRAITIRHSGAEAMDAALPTGYTHFRPFDKLRVVPSDVEGR